MKNALWLGGALSLAAGGSGKDDDLPPGTWRAKVSSPGEMERTLLGEKNELRSAYASRGQSLSPRAYASFLQVVRVFISLGGELSLLA